MKKTVWVFQLFLLFWAAGALAEGLQGCDEHIKYGIPSAKPILLCRMGYALSHDSQKKAARWVAYYLTKEKLEGTQARSDDFRADPDLPPRERSELKDYKIAAMTGAIWPPAADMKWDARAMSESFLLSNMAPQVGAGFNRGIWAFLEERVRDWTMQRGAVFIFTGPIYAERHPHIGPNAVSVPNYFYKVVFDPAKGEAIAFILPNKKLKTEDLPNYITSVDTVEARTSLDFLSELEDSMEDLVEAQIQPSLW